MTREEEHVEPTQEEALTFFETLEKAREVLKNEGRYAGLCKQCLDSQYVFVQEGSYTGVEARMEGDQVEYKRCTHGVDISETVNF